MRNFFTLIILGLVLTGCSRLLPPSAPDAEHGAQIFAQGQDESPPCSTCHRVVSDQVGFSLGPNLAGIAERAGTQIAELTAEEYLRQSILEPRRYVVAGYRDIMYPDYAAHFTEQDVQDLIAYLLTL